MLGVIRTKGFLKSFEKVARSGRLKTSVRESLEEVIDLLTQRKPLPRSYTDHQLKEEFAGYRECHLQGDLLLVY